jgi:hypothetical protein
MVAGTDDKHTINRRTFDILSTDFIIHNTFYDANVVPFFIISKFFFKKNALLHNKIKKMADTNASHSNIYNNV